MPPPLSSLCGRWSASRRRADCACRLQRSIRFPRSIRSHSHRCSCL